MKLYRDLDPLRRAFASGFLAGVYAEGTDSDGHLTADEWVKGLTQTGQFNEEEEADFEEMFAEWQKADAQMAQVEISDRERRKGV